MKGAVSARKTFPGFDVEARELLGGTEKKNVHPMKGHLIFYRKETEKMELLARPDIYNSDKLFDSLCRLFEI